MDLKLGSDFMTNEEKIQAFIFEGINEHGGLKKFLVHLKSVKCPRKLKKGKKLLLREVRKYIHLQSNANRSSKFYTFSTRVDRV